MPSMGDRELVEIRAALDRLEWSESTAYAAYFELGGVHTRGVIDEYLRGERALSDTQHDVFVHGINEAFADRGMDHPIAYRAP